MMEWMLDMDAGILLFLQENVRNEILTPILTLITTLGNGAAVWIIVSLILLIPRKTRQAGAMSLLALLVSFLLNNMLLKNLVARARPYDAIEGLTALVGRPRDYSFPSGHTGSSFASAWVLFRKLPKRFGIPALVLAGLIGLSRLYVGVHYPTDVFFGMINGIASGCIAILLLQNEAVSRILHLEVQ